MWGRLPCRRLTCYSHPSEVEGALTVLAGVPARLVLVAAGLGAVPGAGTVCQKRSRPVEALRENSTLT
jgi:hypothetical protein